MNETLSPQHPLFNKQLLDKLVDASFQGDLEWKAFCSVVGVPPDELNPLPVGILSFESTFIQHYGKPISRRENKNDIIQTWKHDEYMFELIWNKRGKAENGRVRVSKQKPRQKQTKNPGAPQSTNELQPYLFKLPD